MKISTKGRYALRLMIDLAQHDAGGYIPLRDISKRQQISAKYLEQIVVQLSRAGFVISTRGAQGGYQLARHPSEYTVGDIPVSYTHLDVYKRQPSYRLRRSRRWTAGKAHS